VSEVVDDGTFGIERELLGNCFGCGPRNEAGLRLRFRQLSDGAVTTTIDVPAHFCGVDGVVHGGIQATILDEVSGVAAQLALPETADASPCVTAELALRFRRMVSQTEPVTAVARVVRQDGTDFYIDAAIVDAAGDVLTSSSSRWVQLKA
jgi:uncharacterized protein (TIGR00369 family)